MSGKFVMSFLTRCIIIICLAVLAAWIIVLKPFFPVQEIKSADGETTFRYSVKVIGAPLDADLPTVIAFHGHHDRPRYFISKFKNLNMPIRLILLEGFIGHGFDKDVWFIDKQVEKTLPAAALKASAFIELMKKEYAIKKNPVLFGYSQGATLAHYVALYYPEHVSGACVVSGGMYPRFLPTKSSKFWLEYPPVYQYHGKGDMTNRIEMVRANSAILEKNFFPVFLHEYDADHTFTKEMREAAIMQLRSLCSNL